jgi:hypothetical protein
LGMLMYPDMASIEMVSICFCFALCCDHVVVIHDTAIIKKNIFFITISFDSPNIQK